MREEAASGHFRIERTGDRQNAVANGFGVKTTFSMGFDKSVPAVHLPPDLPGSDRAFVVPMQIDVNGSPALFLELLATDAARPFSLCGGIVAGIDQSFPVATTSNPLGAVEVTP